MFATRLARAGSPLRRLFSGHEPFNVCAPNTIMKVPTTELVRQYLPDVKARMPIAEGNWSGYDPRKAKELLGFTAKYLFEAA
jgi:hypothetical protein